MEATANVTRKKKRGLSLRRAQGGRPLLDHMHHHLHLEHETTSTGTRPNTAPDTVAAHAPPLLTAPLPPRRLNHHYQNDMQSTASLDTSAAASASQSSVSVGADLAQLGIDENAECLPDQFWPKDDSDEDDPRASVGHSRATSKTRASSSARFFRAIARKFGKAYKPRYGYLPETEEEHRRNVLQHQIIYELFDGRLHLAPLSSPRRVLDVGTGPGDWCVEFGRKHPNTGVLGIDINPVRPSTAAPKNCRFMIMDATRPWEFKEKFDFIHVRMIGDMHTKGQLISSIYNNLNPGGWLEMTEWIVNLQSPDHSWEGTAFNKWSGFLQQGLKKLGTSVFYPEEYKALLRRSGFIHVTERKYAATTNACYPGKKLQRIGSLMTTNWMGVIEPLTVPVFGALGWSQDEIDALIHDVKKELSDTRYHTYMTLMTVFCQKPGGLMASSSSFNLSQGRPSYSAGGLSNTSS